MHGDNYPVNEIRGKETAQLHFCYNLNSASSDLPWDAIASLHQNQNVLRGSSQSPKMLSQQRRHKEINFAMNTLLENKQSATEYST